MMALLLAAIHALPRFDARIDVRLAKIDVSIGYTLGDVRERTAVSENGQGRAA